MRGDHASVTKLLTFTETSCKTWGPRMPAAEQTIETPRLLLITVTEAMLDAERRGRGLDELLGATVPNTWPPQYWDQNAIDYLYARVHSHPNYRGWCRYVVLKQPSAPPVLIGGCGCTQPPETLDEAEIGYSILEEFRGHGYVTKRSRCSSLDLHLQPCIRCARDLSAPCGIDRCPAQMRIVLDGTGKDPGTVLFRLKRPEH